MLKIFTILTIAYTFGSGFSFNSTMCDKIASQPNQFMPEECRNYNEKEAEKAFNKTKKRHESKEDIIKFSKDADEKQD
jgi:hypothetical protein